MREMSGLLAGLGVQVTQRNEAVRSHIVLGTTHQCCPQRLLLLPSCKILRIEFKRFSMKKNKINFIF